MYTESVLFQVVTSDHEFHMIAVYAITVLLFLPLNWLYAAGIRIGRISHLKV